MLFATTLPLLAGTLLPPVQSDVRGPQPELPFFDDTRHAPPVLSSNASLELPSRSAAPGARVSAASAVPVQDAGGLARPHNRVHVDRPAGADWWVRGATYKARFGADGIEYIPFLGSQAPRNYPLGLQLVSARAGGVALELAQDVQAEHAGDAMAFERGALTERYLLALESVEQTFVFDAPVPGPLAVRVGVETELALLESEAGLAFGNELGGVHVSAAFAVDAAGRRLELETSFDGESYELVVPADFVAVASFPLTIDPIVSTFAIDTFGASLTHPKSSYDPGTGTYYVVYNENFSATDSDIYSVQITINGVSSFADYVDLTADRWHFADTGCARTSDAILVAAVQDLGQGTNGTVQGRIFRPSTSTLEPAFQIDSGLNPGPMHDVCVGGDPFDRFLVVWNRDWTSSDRDVFGRVVTSSGAPVGPANIVLDNSSADMNNVTCSEHNGTFDAGESTWAIAMQYAGATSEIWTARIRWDGVVVQMPAVAYATTLNAIFPHVSSPLEQAGPRTYLITCCVDYGSDYDILGMVLRDNTVTNTTNLSVSGLGGPTYLDDEFYAPVDSNGLRFVLAWRDGNLGGFDTTFVSTVNYFAGGLCVTENSVLDSTGSLYPTNVTAEVDPSVSGADYLIVCEDESLTNEDIYGTHYNDYWGCLGLQYCTPAPNSTGFGGRIYGDGSGVAGTMMTLYANRLPLNQFGYFLVGRTQGVSNPPGSQGTLCLQGNIGRYNASILNSGSGGDFSLVIDTSQVPLNPTTAVLPGETLNFTGWYRDVNPGPTSNFTDGLQITFL